MNTSRIFLTGFMGSGKTTVGRLLAGLLEVFFTDVDELIVQSAGRSIPEIFERDGEESFRKMESEALKLCTSLEGVFGLGGGAVNSEQNRELLHNSGVVVYLKADPATLAERLRDEAEGRPLLAGADRLEDRITSLLEQRAANYETAHLIIETDGLTARDVASLLYEQLMEGVSG